jgi:hypothetical protein
MPSTTLKMKVACDIDRGYRVHAYRPGLPEGQDDYLMVHLMDIPAGETLASCVSECLPGLMALLEADSVEDLTDYAKLAVSDLEREPNLVGPCRPAQKEDFSRKFHGFTHASPMKQSARRKK